MDNRYEVEITPSAQKELYEIILHLGEEASWQTAELVKDGIKAEISKLSNRPESNGLLRDVPGKKYVYRRVLKWSYRIIFTIIEERKLVLVARIDHEKRNPDRLKNLL